MPASRWQSNLNDLFQWIGESDDELMNLIMPSMFANLNKKDSDSANSNSGQTDSARYPDVLPILPLRGVVVYPNTAVPLTVGQPRSIRLVDEVVAGEDRLIGLVTSRDPELEIPEPKDLFEIGTVAMIH